MRERREGPPAKTQGLTPSDVGRGECKRYASVFAPPLIRLPDDLYKAAQDVASDNENAGVLAVIEAGSGAPEFPLGPKDVEQLTAAELNVAQLARKSIRHEVQHGQSEIRFFEGRQELAKVKSDINKRRLKKAARNVRAKKGAYEQAVLSAESASEVEEDDLGPTPPRSSPAPVGDDVIDLTADEGDD